MTLCRVVVLFLCAVLLLLAAPTAALRAATAAGGVTVAASLGDANVDAGQGTEYRIDVVGGRADQVPPTPVVEGLRFTYAGQTYSTQFDFNALSKSTTTSYIFNVDTTRGGKFVIPGQNVSVDGASLRTLPVTLNVGDNGQGGGATAPKSVFVELLVPRKSAYLGETIPVEVRTYFAMTLPPAQLTPDLILNGEGFSVGKFTPQREMAAQVVEGANYRVASAKSAITGLKVGTLSVGPVEVDPIVRLPAARTRRRSAYNDPFDALLNGGGFGGMGMQPPQQVKLLSTPVEVEIKPLPAQGRPAEFSGAIGQFKLEAQAEPRKAQTGDPITVHLMLSGRGNFDRIGAPELSDEQGLKTYPPSARFKADDEVNTSGVKMFDQVVIAEGPRASLPGYRFHYFDPATGKYVQLDTPPIPVRIEGANLATPTPAPAAVAAASPPAGSATPRATPTPPPRRAEDILYIRNDEGPRAARDAFLPVYRQRGFWLAQGGGLALLLAAAGFGFARTRSRNEAVRQGTLRQRQQAELQRALQAEGTGRREFYFAATRLAQMRAAGNGRQAADANLGAREICRDRQLDPQTAGSVEEMFRRHDELAYSGGDVAQEPVPPEERRGVLATLDTLGRSSKA